MKKFGKFLFGTITLASIAAGAYYVYKNFIKKNESDDFEDFEDDFEDFDAEDDEDSEKDSRGYVPINLASEDSNDDEEADIPGDNTAAAKEEDEH